VFQIVPDPGFRDWRWTLGFDDLQKTNGNGNVFGGASPSGPSSFFPVVF
jgi:hypothetical protein